MAKKPIPAIKGPEKSKYRKDYLQVKVSQETIDQIKKLGMTGTLNAIKTKGVKGVSTQFLEGANRMYGNARVRAAINANTAAANASAKKTAEAKRGLTTSRAISKSQAATASRGAALKKSSTTGVTRSAAIAKSSKATAPRGASRVRKTGRGN